MTSTRVAITKAIQWNRMSRSLKNMTPQNFFYCAYKFLNAMPSAMAIVIAGMVQQNHDKMKPVSLMI